LRDPDRHADVDAGDASGAGQVLHPTNAFSGA